MNPFIPGALLFLQDVARPLIAVECRLKMLQRPGGVAETGFSEVLGRAMYNALENESGNLR